MRPKPSKSVAQQLIHGSAWMIAMRWALRLLGVLSTIVLARLLVPADFGIVAMAAVVAGLLDTASYAGVDLALIRAHADTREYRDSAWTIQVLQSVAVAGLLVVVAPLATLYYGEPRVAIVMQWLALKSVLDGLQNIGVVAFRKELDFAKEFRFNLYSKLMNLGVVVAAAFAMRDYLALVVGMVSGSLITLALSYAMHEFRPRFSFAKVGELWSFSNWLLLSRVGSFLTRKADQFIAGGIVGTSALGNYHVASEIATMPTNELVMPMRRALFPTLSTLQHDAVAFRSTVLQTFSALAIVCFSAGFGLLAVADEFVPLLLGAQWHDAVRLVQWLALYGAFASLASVLEVPVWVSGRTQISALQSWLELIVLVPAIIFAVRGYGIEGAALARALVAGAMLLPMLYLTSRVCPLRFADLVAGVWRPLAAGLAMAACLLVPFSYPGSALIVLGAKIVAGTVIYASSLLLLWLIAGRPDGIEALALQRVRLAIKGGAGAK